MIGDTGRKGMPEETLSIRHGEMLVEVLGMELGEIWQKLIDFVLWGEPDKYEDLRGYRLFWAWKAIVMLQAGEKMYVAGENDGWADPNNIVAEILGWKYRDVLDAMPKSAQLTVNYSEDTWLVQAVYGIVVAYIKQSHVPYAKDGDRKPFLEPGKWYWNMQADCPAFLRSYVNRQPRVLMPIVQTDDGPSMNNDDTLYTLTSFNDVVVDIGALCRIIPRVNELDY